MADQRATGDVGQVVAFPCRELLATDDVRQRAAALLAVEPWGREQWERLSEGQTFDGMESWLPWLTSGEHLLTDLLPDDALVLLVEPRRMRDRAQDLLDEETSLGSVLSGTWGVPDGSELPRLSLPFDRLLQHTTADTWTVLGTPESPDTPFVSGTALRRDRRRRRGVGRPAEHAAVRGLEGRAGGRRARLGQAPARRARARAAPTCRADDVVVAPLDRGFLISSLKLAVIGEADLTGRRRVHRKARGARRGQDLYDDLKPGDFVVHDVHGVGRYEGMVQRAIGGVERDYLLLGLQGRRQALRAHRAGRDVRRYTGGETPTLHRLGGSDFAKTRSKVRKAIREIAAGARPRSTSSASPCPGTPSPRHAVAARDGGRLPLRADARPGQGHRGREGRPRGGRRRWTAWSAATSATARPRSPCAPPSRSVQDGKQVAVLVPTTLLANQHGVPSASASPGYPVRVEVLSRFLSAKEQEAVVAGVKLGRGRRRHRHPPPAVGGCRVQGPRPAGGRRGAALRRTHKERIKALRANVDVLTLTATPIPRTLEMSLTGIRDLSLVNTPPEDRQPILTYVGEYDDRAVAEAVRRELLREGQVFFVHNRVADIEHVAADLRALVPEARVAVAHGQMDEGTLERVVLDFVDREFDVLVCTTIIESGIDMPSVNTLVVDRADLLGLAQLYQIRGRVGRSGQRAYAYLFHPADQSLTEEAYERLKTIGEFTELGSGFKIAMRDLEIRGAGNLLGASQSGHIAAVGFDLYVRMVHEAVAELKGEELPVEAEITIDVPVDANLPRDYVTPRRPPDGGVPAPGGRPHPG